MWVRKYKNAVRIILLLYAMVPFAMVPLSPDTYVMQGQTSMQRLNFTPTYST